MSPTKTTNKGSVCHGDPTRNHLAHTDPHTNMNNQFRFVRDHPGHDEQDYPTIMPREHPHSYRKTPIFNRD